MVLSSKTTLHEKLSGARDNPETAFIVASDPPGLAGQFVTEGVRITCIPLEDEFVKNYVPGLPELDWEPD